MLEPMDAQSAYYDCGEEDDGERQTRALGAGREADVGPEKDGFVPT